MCMCGVTGVWSALMYAQDNERLLVWPGVTGSLSPTTNNIVGGGGGGGGGCTSSSPDPFIKHPYLRLSTVLMVMLARLSSLATAMKLYKPDGNFFMANCVTVRAKEVQDNKGRCACVKVCMCEGGHVWKVGMCGRCACVKVCM